MILLDTFKDTIFLNIHKKKDIDYYEYYKNKYCNDIVNKEELKIKLIKFKKKSKRNQITSILYI